MSDIYDYIGEKGDSLFSEQAFNEVDALVFAWLSYYEVEKLDAAGVQCRGMSLSDIAGKSEEVLGEFRRPDKFVKLVSTVTGAWMLGVVAKKKRFASVVIGDFKSIYDPLNSIQFSVTSYYLGSDVEVIAFRGTDTTVAGWKEDCLTSFSEVVPSQDLALQYLNERSRSKRRIILAGHSKGGNLAIYAAAKSRKSIVPRIEAVYNFDGPGFCFDINRTPNFMRIKDCIHSYIPGSSVVGMLLNHMDDYTIVSSSNVGIMQHYAFYWKIKGCRFVTQRKLNTSSRSMDQAFRQWLQDLSFEERKKFVETVFSVFENAGIEDFSSLSSAGIRKNREIISKMKNLDDQTRNMIKSFLGVLMRAYRRELKASAEQTYDKVKDIVSERVKAVLPDKTV